MPSRTLILSMVVLVSPSLVDAQETDPVFFSEVISWDKVRTGETVILDQLTFVADSAQLTEEHLWILDDLSVYLLQHPRLRITITGHTNTKPQHAYCDALSAARAEAVKAYLVTMGVPEEVITTIGMGKQQPLYPDDTYDPQKQRRNQRVEVKLEEVKE
ncbi:MAG: OmpA family protein [Saprospiraceae bacterium]|nr:OmpA family protein [Saprospiraceae bacterium]